MDYYSKKIAVLITHGSQSNQWEAISKLDIHGTFTKSNKVVDGTDVRVFVAYAKGKYNVPPIPHKQSL